MGWLTLFGVTMGVVGAGCAVWAGQLLRLADERSASATRALRAARAERERAEAIHRECRPSPFSVREPKSGTRWPRGVA